MSEIIIIFSFAKNGLVMYRGCLWVKCSRKGGNMFRTFVLMGTWVFFECMLGCQWSLVCFNDEMGCFELWFFYVSIGILR
jgi:hypothetical protein